MKLILLVLLLVVVSLNSVSANATDDNSPKLPPAPELRQALDVTIVTTISVEALKRTFKDERPVGEGYAFPSGHASLAFALARVASEYHPKYRALWYAIAIRVAWSRVKHKAHDWQDVIGGAALGYYIGDRAVENSGIVLKKWEW